MHDPFRASLLCQLSKHFIISPRPLKAIQIVTYDFCHVSTVTLSLSKQFEFKLTNDYQTILYMF